MYQYLGSTEILLYNLVGMMSTFALVIFNLSQINRKKKIMSLTGLLVHREFLKEYRKRHIKIKFLSSLAFWAAIEILIFSAAQYLPIGAINTTFGNLVGTGANYFGFASVNTIVIIALSLIVRANPLKQIDFLTPALPLALVVSKIACFCHGCCGGIEWQYGLYNHLSERVEFPVQLVEAGSALLIFIFLMLWRDKAKTGMLYPVYLILYSSTRFFSEFLRFEEDVFLIFKTYHILCIIGVIVGIIEIVIVRKFGDRISTYFDTKIGNAMNENLPANKKKKRS